MTTLLPEKANRERRDLWLPWFFCFFSDWCSRRTAANENTIIVSLSWLHSFWFFKKVLKQLVFVVFGFQFIDFLSVMLQVTF